MLLPSDRSRDSHVGPKYQQRPVHEIYVAKEPALGWALFSYVVLITLVITLFPFRFQWPERIHFLWFGGWSDTLLNVLFFLPLGFLYKLIRPEDSILRVLGLGLGLSCAIEVAQIFLAERFPSPMDVLTNGIGSMAGSTARRKACSVS